MNYFSISISNVQENYDLRAEETHGMPGHSAKVQFLHDEIPFIEWQERNIECLMGNFFSTDGFGLGDHLYLEVFRDGKGLLDLCVWVHDQTTPAFILQMPVNDYYKAAEKAVDQLVAWENHETI